MAPFESVGRGGAADLIPRVLAVLLSHVCRMSVATYSQLLTATNAVLWER